MEFRSHPKGRAGRVTRTTHRAAWLSEAELMWRWGLLALACGEPCLERLQEDPVVQFTSEACSCCYDLESFIQAPLPSIFLKKLLKARCKSH